MGKKGFSIGRKIGLGFAILIIALAVLSWLSFSGIGDIISDGEAAIESSDLDASLAAREAALVNGKVYREAKVKVYHPGPKKYAFFMQ